MVEIVCQLKGGRLQAGALEIFLHDGFILETRHLPGFQAGVDVEISPEPGILLEPVFIVGFEPVDPAVAVSEIAYSPHHFIVIFQGLHLVIFCQCVAEVRMEIVIIRVSDAEYVDTVVLEAHAEITIDIRIIR